MKENHYKNIAQALSYYIKWKKEKKTGNGIPQKLIQYLIVLDEVDAINNHLYGKSQKYKLEYLACKWYIEGVTPNEIIMTKEMQSGNISLYQLKEWLEGSKERRGFTDYMYEKFMEINRSYCPFCDRDGGGGGSSGLSPLHGNPCPCRNKG